MVRIFFLFIISFLSTSAFSAVIATVDRTEIAINESINLRYESSDEENRTPDFSPLNKDFDIIGQNRENSVNIINGNTTRKTIFNLTLAPKKVGSLSIPEISFSKSTSASIQVNVKQSVNRGKEKDFTFTVSADKKSAFIQEQILITIKMARAVNVQQESISDLEFSHNDVIIEPLSDQYKQYEAMLNGRRHIVYERKFAIFPQKEGSLILKPIFYNASVIHQQSRRGFFDDPFFNRNSGKRIRERSELISFSIKSKPQEFSGKNWLPAKDIQVSAEFSDDISDIKVGDSITRTITIKADQQLSSTIPSINNPEPNGARIYPDQAEDNQGKAKYGIYSSRTQRLAIVPTQAGTLHLPEQKIEWWNTQSQRKEVASIPATSLNIKAANNTALNPSNNNPENASTQVESHSSNSGTSSYWFYLACFAFLGWAATIGAWLYFSFGGHKKPKSTAFTKSNLIKVCKKRDAKAAKQALLSWANSEWSNQNITNLGSISNLANDENLSTSINELQNHLYNKKSNIWNPNSLITSLEKFNTDQLTAHKSKKEHMLFKI